MVGRRIVALVNDINASHHPKLIRTEYGFAVTDGLVSLPTDTFNEGRDLLKLATTHGMAAAEDQVLGKACWEGYDDEDGSVAYGEMLERRAEQGTWWGRDDF